MPIPWIFLERAKLLDAFLFAFTAVSKDRRRPFFRSFRLTHYCPNRGKADRLTRRGGRGRHMRVRPEPSSPQACLPVEITVGLFKTANMR
ncbi:hypothetical protein [Candidatus Methylacidiphilum infernorum]|uniref:hypothetical protein n=1 Tax=Candidatus Methylacidiphilum infernorum TaxID=511746 RepID=UPI0011D0D619|nr:hypothetical protein [Candidatus Methylacidiphilum infernorum]